MGQSINKIEHLNYCTKLKELWLCESNIEVCCWPNVNIVKQPVLYLFCVQRIEGLTYIKHLRRLFLYDNKIKRIENIGHFLDLEVLWLNINDIEEIEVSGIEFVLINFENLFLNRSFPFQGLTELRKLKELNLAQNKIKRIGSNTAVHIAVYFRNHVSRLF